MPADNPRTDQDRSIGELCEIVREFVAERNWQQFHSPKNLSMSLAIEAGELMEHFQWITTDESRAVATNAAKVAEVAEEIADVFCYTLALVNELGVDLSDALMRKMAKNSQKYPVAEFRGRFGKEDPRPPAID